MCDSALMWVSEEHLHPRHNPRNDRLHPLSLFSHLVPCVYGPPCRYDDGDVERLDLDRLTWHPLEAEGGHQRAEGDPQAAVAEGHPRAEERSGARSGGRHQQRVEEQAGRPDSAAPSSSRQAMEGRAGQHDSATPSGVAAEQAAVIEAQVRLPLASPRTLLPQQIFEGLGSGIGSGGGAVHQVKERSRGREPLQPAAEQSADKRDRGGGGGGVAARPRGEAPPGQMPVSGMRQPLGVTGANVRQPPQGVTCGGADVHIPAKDGPRAKGSGTTGGGQPGDLCIVATLISNHVKSQFVARLKRLCKRLGNAGVGIDVTR